MSTLGTVLTASDLTTDLFNQLNNKLNNPDLYDAFNLSSNLNVMDRKYWSQWSTPLARAQAWISLNGITSTDPHIIAANNAINATKNAVANSISLSQNVAQSLITALSSTIPNLISSTIL